MGETTGDNQHKMERWHNPQSREGGGCLAENAYQKKKQNNVHHKGEKAKHTALCYCVSSQITLAAPRLGAEEGVGRTTTKNEHEKPIVLCLCLAARLLRPWPRPATTGPALSEGSVGQENLKNYRTNQAAQPNHAKDAPNPDSKTPEHLKEPKDKSQISIRRSYQK